MEDSECEGSESQHQTEIPFPEIQQPPEINVDGSNESGKWSSGLFDCCNNPRNALVTALLPCRTFGQIAEIVDQGNITCRVSAMIYLASVGVCWIGPVLYLVSMGSFYRCLPCKLSTKYRVKLRSEFNIPEGPAPDEVTHYLCECCALCQEYRELQSRGFDPSLGWEKNKARNEDKNQQQTMKSPSQQEMKK